MNIELSLSTQTTDTIIYVLAFVMVLRAGVQVMKVFLRFNEQLDEKYKNE